MIERNPIMRMLLLLWAGCLAIGVHGASVSWNCFDVVPGYTPHIVSTAEGFTAIDFAVDNYGESSDEKSDIPLGNGFGLSKDGSLDNINVGRNGFMTLSPRSL